MRSSHSTSPTPRAPPSSSSMAPTRHSPPPTRRLSRRVRPGSRAAPAHQRRQRPVLAGRPGRAHLRQPRRRPRRCGLPDWVQAIRDHSPTPVNGVQDRSPAPAASSPTSPDLPGARTSNSSWAPVVLVLVLLLLIYRSPVLPFVPLIAVGIRHFVAGGILALVATATGTTLRPGDVAHGHLAVRRRDRLRPAPDLPLSRGPAPSRQRPRRARHGARRDMGGDRRQRPDSDSSGARPALRPVRRLPLVCAHARRRRLRDPDRRADADAGAARAARPPGLLAAVPKRGRDRHRSWERVAGSSPAGPSMPRPSSPPSSSSWRSAASSTVRASASPTTT